MEIRVWICTSCLYDKRSCHCNYGQFIEAPLGLDHSKRRQFVNDSPNGIGGVWKK